MTGGATAGSSRAHRLDPHILPARSSPADGGPTGPVFTIDRQRAVVRRPGRTGPATMLTVPLGTYDGVSVRVEPRGGSGEVRVFVELRHADPSLTLPLVVADKPEDAAADWRAWGRTLNLPLLVVAPDGTVIAPVEMVGGITIAATKPRRRHSYFAARRPRFLTRRKTGRSELMVRLAGREIIARN